MFATIIDDVSREPTGLTNQQLFPQSELRAEDLLGRDLPPSQPPSFRATTACLTMYFLRGCIVAWAVVCLLFFLHTYFDGPQRLGIGALEDVLWPGLDPSGTVLNISTHMREYYRLALLRRPPSKSIAIVLSGDATAIAGYTKSIATWNCYATKHNIALYVEPVFADRAVYADYAESRNATNITDLRLHGDMWHLSRFHVYCWSRLRNIAKHLVNHEFVVHADLDTLPIQHNQSLLDIVSRTGGDIALQYVDNGELTAAFYIVKNSLKGWRFLAWWESFETSYPPHWNADNGDLHSVVSVLLHGWDMFPCKTERMDSIKKGDKYYNNYFLPCIQRIARGWDSPILHKDAGLYIWPSYGGIFRMFQPAWPHQPWNCLLPTDLFGHGKKYDTLLSQKSWRCEGNAGQVDYRLQDFTECSTDYSALLNKNGMRYATLCFDEDHKHVCRPP